MLGWEGGWIRLACTNETESYQNLYENLKILFN